MEFTKQDIDDMIDARIKLTQGTSPTASTEFVSNEGEYAIAKLGPNATNSQIINKLNEFINQFNKTLRRD